MIQNEMVNESLQAFARRKHVELGGRATLDDIYDAMVTEDANAVVIGLRTAAKSAIRRALIEHDAGGLPNAVSVGGEYVARRLFDVSDYEVAAKAYVDRGADNIEVARRLEAECVATYGVTVGVDHLIRQAVA